MAGLVRSLRQRGKGSVGSPEASPQLVSDRLPPPRQLSCLTACRLGHLSATTKEPPPLSLSAFSLHLQRQGRNLLLLPLPLLPLQWCIDLHCCDS